jgi:aminopeptidase N
MKNMKNRIKLSLLFISLAFISNAQNREFNRQDTLRGSITKERAWWDLTYYHLDIRVNPADSTIRGKNTVQYRVLEPLTVMQIDLQAPMQIEKVLQDGKEVPFSQDGNAWFIKFPGKQAAGAVKEVVIFYAGKPKVSRNPPWDGGLSWRKDANGNDFIVTTCQGDGASLWWPCKDHLYDEPDSMFISVTTPGHVMDVSNGRLRASDENRDGSKTWHWFVTNPISNYVVNINIGDYAYFSEKYFGEKGVLDCDYYVLKDNLEKAKTQFDQVPMMLRAFEYWFGPYAFYEDGFKLVEVPYPGMEHQSSVTYGNGYKNGYGGRDVSGTGWGMKFDFIIIHESGHEWFANNITYKDIADMWVHEGFTAYSESLFLDYHYGKKAASEYVIGTRRNISNRQPVIGVYDVNRAGSGDMYSKAANMLHTLRQIANDDEKWRKMLRGLNETFYHQTVTTQQIEDFLSQHTGRDLTAFFNQYLRDVRIPVLEYKLENGQLSYRWNNCVEGFDMPVKVFLDQEEMLLFPTTKWGSKSISLNISNLEGDANYYVTFQKFTGK